MSDTMSSKSNAWKERIYSLSHAFICTVLAALPLAGLVFFFELTRPSGVAVQGLPGARLSMESGSDSITKFAFSTPVVHFRGVSAERGAAATQDSRLVSASEAQGILTSLAFSALLPGFESEFTSKDGRRIAVRIVSRDPAGDQIINAQDAPETAIPASTAKRVNFTWGSWVYSAELEDRGPESSVVVQKVL